MLQGGYSTAIVRMADTKPSVVELQEFLEMLRRTVKLKGKEIYTAIIEDEAVLVIPCNEDSPNLNLNQTNPNKMVHLLRKLLHNDRVSLCLGKRVDKPEELNISYREANQIHKISIICALDQPVLTNDELGVYSLLYLLPECEEVKTSSNACIRTRKPTKLERRTKKGASAMKIGVSVLLLCLLISGCSQAYHSAIQSPTQVQSLEQPAGQTPAKVSNGLLGFQQDEWIFSVTPTKVPKSTKKPMQRPKPTPTPRATLKKNKELSVPAQQSQQKKLTLPQLRLKYPQFFRLNGSTQENKIALTFDDGPDNKYTPAILDILRKYHVKATFFVLGVRAQANPSIIRRIVNEGHVIGNHSYDHANPAKMTEAQFEKQFTRTQLILHNLIGYEPKLIRTPYGALQENQLRWAANNGLIAVNWDIDSLDWKELNDSQVVANIMEHTHKGAIILQHSAGGDNQDLSGTIKALPIVIEQLKKQGFKLVTVPELLHLPAAK